MVWLTCTTQEPTNISTQTVNKRNAQAGYIRETSGRVGCTTLSWQGRLYNSPYSLWEVWPCGQWPGHVSSVFYGKIDHVVSSLVMCLHRQFASGTHDWQAALAYYPCNTNVIHQCNIRYIALAVPLKVKLPIGNPSCPNLALPANVPKYSEPAEIPFTNDWTPARSRIAFQNSTSLNHLAYLKQYYSFHTKLQTSSFHCRVKLLPVLMIISVRNGSDGVLNRIVIHFRTYRGGPEKK